MPQSNERRNVVLGVTGSIAAYKSAELARLLVSRGFDVKTVMTESAMQFITPLTMGTLTCNSVVTSFWDEGGDVCIDHISLADWADVIVIAPATADIIGKLASGCADTPILALALSSRAPILLAPAMNVNMWEHPQTQTNVAILKERGLQIIQPDEGSLACGSTGGGRLAEPWEIFHEVRRASTYPDLRGKHILITTGPTCEVIDPVRFISNRSSGKMGVALAREAFRRGAKVTLVHGPVNVRVPRRVTCLPVVSAAEMHSVVMEQAFSEEEPVDAVVMAAAVADYKPAKTSDTKIKKTEKLMSLDLEKNTDILGDLGSKRGKKRSPVLVGFAVETGEMEQLFEEARRKMTDKGADMIVGNFAEDAFDLDTNHVWLVDRTGRQTEVATTYKSRVANKIFENVVKLF